MAERTYSLNSYESPLSSAISDASLTVTVDSVVGLRAPGYLVVDPDDPTKREYFLYSSISGNDLIITSLGNRGLLGTTGGLPSGHDVGARVRAVAVHQWIDDIWSSIEAGELWDTNHEGSSGDPHAAAGYLKQSVADPDYVNVSGDTMAGKLTLDGAPTADLHAATKKYIDDAIPPGATLRETLVFSLPGDLEVKNGVGRFLLQYDGTVTGVQATVGTPSTGSQVAVRVNVGGGDQAATVAAGDQDGPRLAPSLAAPLGTLITVDVTGIGSGDPGADLTVMVLIVAT